MLTIQTIIITLIQMSLLTIITITITTEQCKSKYKDMKHLHLP
jgi:hypothetical protein